MFIFFRKNICALQPALIEYLLSIVTGSRLPKVEK